MDASAQRGFKASGAPVLWFHSTHERLHPAFSNISEGRPKRGVGVSAMLLTPWRKNFTYGRGCSRRYRKCEQRCRSCRELLRGGPSLARMRKLFDARRTRISPPPSVITDHVLLAGGILELREAMFET